MAGPGARPPAGGAAPSSDGLELTRARRPLEYIASLLEGLRLVAQSAQLPFLAYLIDVALEEANTEKANRG
jgi:hypothetical protein